MSDYNINKMDFKQLRNEVQLLRDELAIMKRKYEDLLYNLDTDNFSQRIVKQSKDMYTKIEQTAEEITLQAEKVDANETNIATLQVTAKEISSEVTEVKNDVSTNSTKITQNANAISAEVTARKEAVTDLSTEISQTAESIQMAVNATYSTPIEVTTWSSSNKDKSKVYYVTNENLYYYYDGYDWVSSVNATFGTLFEQTATGFKMAGNVTLDGNLISNANIAGSTLSSRNGNTYGDGAVLNGVNGTIDMYWGGGSAPISQWSWTDGGSYIGATTGGNFGVAFDGWRIGTDDNRNMKIESKTRGNGDDPRMFIVDVSASGSDYKEVKFIGLNSINEDETQPTVYAAITDGRECLLATQDWVIAQGFTGGGVAIFG